jgi:hypothetical protein
METAIMNTTHSTFRFLVSRLLPLLVGAFAAAGAMAQADPPARVGTLTDIQGSVAFAPPGENEWADAQRNRPVTGGDRLWTDRGARAELHLGSAVLHIDGQSYLDVTHLDDGAFQASLNEGTVNAHVRELDAQENFEIDTPQLALRAAQPGDWRVDVDPATGTTSVIVHSGAAVVYGARGESLQLQAGQQLAFTGRDLQQVAMPPLRDGGFDRYAADRNRAEDQSVAARYVPRDVVGYRELDAYGNWSEDPTYGAVWFPRITVSDWAPYRYGHWAWIDPWGWTWIDDAPWGFAPFHYGRWTVINSRWCWVPGRLGPRPVYSPALVAFVGGGGFNLTIGSGPGIGWFPLAPGEAWRPTFRASTNYVRNVNRNFRIDDRAEYFFHRQPTAVTSVRVEDFTRGRPVHQHWQRASANEITRAPVATTPSLPRAEPRHFAETARPPRTQVQPPALAGVGGNRPQGQFVPPGLTRAPGLARTPPGLERKAEETRAPTEQRQRVQQERATREQERAQRAQQMQQERAAREQERAQRSQQREQAQAQRQQLIEQQRERAARQQQAQAAAQERAQERAQVQQQRAAQAQAQAQARAQQHQQAAQAAAAERAMGAQGDERRGPPARQSRGSDDEERGRGHGRGNKD